MRYDQWKPRAILKRLLLGERPSVEEELQRLTKSLESIRRHNQAYSDRILKMSGKVEALCRHSDEYGHKIKQIEQHLAEFNTQAASILLGIEASRHLSSPPEKSQFRSLEEQLYAEIKGLLDLYPADAFLERAEELQDIDMRFRSSARSSRQYLTLTESVITQIYLKLSRAYIEQIKADQPGRKLNTLLKETAIPQIRRHVKTVVREERARIVVNAIKDGTITWSNPLPRYLRFGANLDERVVELPLAWDVAQLEKPGHVLDAGSAFNQPSLRPLLSRPAARLTHVTLSGAKEMLTADDDIYSYVFCDLRDLRFKDESFSRVICLSTLEHVGMDNRRYGGGAESDPDAYLQAFDELLRVLEPNGRLLLTFPYGEPTVHGWYRIFGQSDVDAMLKRVKGFRAEMRYFNYDGFWFDADSSVPEPSMIAVRDGEEITGVAALLITKPSVTGPSEPLQLPASLQ